MALSVYNSAAFSTASGVAVAGGATVSIRLESSGALATIYANRDSAGSPALANPLTADSVGRFAFYAAPVDQGYSVRVQFGAEDHTVHNVLDLEPFTASGSSLALTLQGEARRLIYPEHFGCSGDGTTDDSDNFQLAATAAVGKILKLTPGASYVIADINIGTNTTVDMTGATVKHKIDGSPSTGAPIFNVIGAKVTFIGGDIDGQKSGQSQDGFSDSFNTGGGGLGRAYRAAIKADLARDPTVTDLTVRGVRFLNLYGACVATQDIQVVRVQDCKAKTCNFELAYLYFRTGSPSTQGTDAIVTGNVIDSPGSGHATVNSNGIGISNYRRVVCSYNSCYNIERTLIKVEGGQNIKITNNVIDTNTKDNFPGIQIDSTTYTSTRVLVSQNQIFNVGRGISISSDNTTQIVISGNVIYTTTGTSTGDGISIDDGDDVIISANNLYDIKRHGVIAEGSIRRITVNGNQAYGQGGTGTSYAMIFSLTDSSWNSAIVRGNIFQNFTSGPATEGVVTFARGAISPTPMLNFFLFQGNIILAGSSSNRAFNCGLDVLASGVISDNYMDGTFSDVSTGGVRHRNNTVTGTVTLATGLANVEEFGATQTTVGAAGGATALPGTPTGYHEIVVNGTSRIVPFYAKS